MVHSTRQRFLRFSDWYDFINAIKSEDSRSINLYELRQATYSDIETVRGRPLIVYAAKFPFPPLPPQFPHPPITIDLEDVDGFVDLAASISGDEVDILLHSPGGSPEATERIVNILRSRFNNVSFLIPHSAYSAATMLALSGNEIVLHWGASLGPIDPQVNGVPARALRRGFEKAKQALKEEGPEALPAYIPLIEKYTLEVLEICEDYEQLSRELATEWLSKYMYGGSTNNQQHIAAAVDFFTNYDSHRTHSRALTYDKIQHLNLNINVANDELSSLLREAYILLNGFFNVTPFVKVYENNNGVSWGKQYQVVHQPPQQPQQSN